MVRALPGRQPARTLRGAGARAPDDPGPQAARHRGGTPVRDPVSGTLPRWPVRGPGEEAAPGLADGLAAMPPGLRATRACARSGAHRPAAPGPDRCAITR